MHPLLGIGLKLASTFVFAIMLVLVKWGGGDVPAGEVVFFRSFFALLPVVGYIVWRGEFVAAFRTQRLGGQFYRAGFGAVSMCFWFASVARLPIADALAISYAGPLITVGLAAIMLGELVKPDRWAAVALGFAGVVVILSPHLAAFRHIGADVGATGAAFGLVGAFFGALAAVQTSELTRTEPTTTIVLYFTIFSTMFGLFTVPFGWIVPGWQDGLALAGAGVFGGIGQLLLTSSYRHAKASTVAPLEYASMLWAILFGFWMFGEVPGYMVAIGSAVVMVSGLIVVLRERADETVDTADEMDDDGAAADWPAPVHP
ncbi:MAG: DMT family transporter [Ancalomicrobiaceae bacterium]|nr:DMT family transporter [Ancalomicrobiaceae bacterium]